MELLQLVGDFKIHTFTGPGTFTVCSATGNPANNLVDYLVVAGGGGGGSDYGGGGGGAGGFREDKSPVTPYTASPLDGAGSLNSYSIFSNNSWWWWSKRNTSSL